MQYIIMCRSLTYAQRAARILEREGIYAGLSKAPQGATPEGCTFGVKLAERHWKRGLEILSRAGIRVGRVFALTEDGKSKEVRV